MTHERYCFNCAKAVPCQALLQPERSTAETIVHLMCTLCGRHLGHLDQAASRR
ncbi:MAG TPA: hypothetical protein VIK11_10295 [Tepidiformaceae bacterium]|jgi:hypothetical protein